MAVTFQRNSPGMKVQALPPQVDAAGNVWVAGKTENSLDGQQNAGGTDVFLMKFSVPRLGRWSDISAAIRMSDYVGRVLPPPNLKLRFFFLWCSLKKESDEVSPGRVGLHYKSSSC